MVKKNLEIPLVAYNLAATLHTSAQPSKHILLSLIGFTATKERYSDFLDTFANELGITSLVFDYSGHGESPFLLEKITPAQHFLEVITVFDWLKEQYADHTVTVMGSSYGGYLATQLTKYRTFENLILRAPAIYKPQDFYTTWANLDRNQKSIRENPAALAEHPLLKRASKFSGNTLVVVHENDEMVPAPTTDAYQQAFGADTYMATGFPHGLMQVPAAQQTIYKQAIIDWLKKQGG